MNLTCSVRGRGQALMHSPLSKREKKIFFSSRSLYSPFTEFTSSVYLSCFLERVRCGGCRCCSLSLGSCFRWKPELPRTTTMIRRRGFTGGDDFRSSSSPRRLPALDGVPFISLRNRVIFANGARVCERYSNQPAQPPSSSRSLMTFHLWPACGRYIHCNPLETVRLVA